MPAPIGRPPDDVNGDKKEAWKDNFPSATMKVGPGPEPRPKGKVGLRFGELQTTAKRQRLLSTQEAIVETTPEDSQFLAGKRLRCAAS
jgi:hypothetical protein